MPRRRSNRTPVDDGHLTDLDAVEVPDPVIVVAVQSARARGRLGLRPTRRFRLASVMHDLIADAVRRAVIHHRSAQRGLVETRIAIEGLLDRTPPGLNLPVAERFASLPAVGDGA